MHRLADEADLTVSALRNAPAATTPPWSRSSLAEESHAGHGLPSPRGHIREHDRVQMVATTDSDDFGAQVHLDTTVDDDAGREVARHRDSQIVAAHDEPDPRPATREKQGRLPGGVGPADHGHLRAVAPARAGFKLGCRGVDAVALEVCPPLEAQFLNMSRAALRLELPASDSVL
jgi:hypothetical protein